MGSEVGACCATGFSSSFLPPKGKEKRDFFGLALAASKSRVSASISGVFLYAKNIITPANTIPMSTTKLLITYTLKLATITATLPKPSVPSAGETMDIPFPISSPESLISAEVASNDSAEPNIKLPKNIIFPINNAPAKIEIPNLHPSDIADRFRSSTTCSSLTVSSLN